MHLIFLLSHLETNFQINFWSALQGALQGASDDFPSKISPNFQIETFCEIPEQIKYIQGYKILYFSLRIFLNFA
jgi:hypothetical protein